MEPLALKLMLIFFMCVIPLGFGLLPMKIIDYLTRQGGRSANSRTLVSVFTCFAAGVILGVSFIELFPEAREGLEELAHDNKIFAEYPFVELFVGIGFLLVYFVEEFMTILFGHSGHGHSHGGVEAAPNECRQSSPNDYYHRCTASARRGIVNDAMSADSTSENDVREFTSSLCSFYSHTIRRMMAIGNTVAVGEQRPLSPNFETSKNRHVGVEQGYASMASRNNIAEPLQVNLLTSVSASDTLGSPGSHSSQSITAEEFGSAMRIASSNSDIRVRSMKAINETSSDSSSDDCVSHRNAVISAITLVTALFLHTSLEGFAFGVQKEVISVGSLFFGIVVHKVLVFFSVGINLVQALPNNPRLVIAFVVLLASFSPIGAIVGIIVETWEIGGEINGIISTILICVSIGTFLYIALFEILAPERLKRVNRLLQWTGCTFGFALMSAVLSLARHDHGHSHGGHGELHQHAHATII